MTYLFLIIIILIIVSVGGLVSVKWNDSARKKIDSVKKERTFWMLMNGYDGMAFNLYWVFTIYLDPRHLATFLTGSDSLLPKSLSTEEDVEIKSLVSQEKGIENLNIIRKLLGERDETIKHFFDKDDQHFTKSGIKKIFDKRKDEIFVMDKYDEFVSYYLKLLPNHEHLTKSDIWETRKRLEEKAGDLEWKNEEEKVDFKTMFDLKKAQMEIGDVVSGILSEDGKNGSLKKSLKEWEQLQMISWCIIDYSVAWQGTNGIQQFMWKILASFA